MKTKDNADRYIYHNKISGYYRIMVWKDGKQLYLGTYTTIEAARTARDEMFPNGINPFAKHTHSWSNHDVKGKAIERLNEAKKESGIK